MIAPAEAIKKIPLINRLDELETILGELDFSALPIPADYMPDAKLEYRVVWWVEENRQKMGYEELLEARHAIRALSMVFERLAELMCREM